MGAGDLSGVSCGPGRHARSESEPSDIPVGRVAVVADPFGNPLTILDLTRGRYLTDADGKVTGTAEAGKAPTPDDR